jgi:2-polyprenyl-3-methyl-5-hydroxy-6-metoxy-1,4-benzoquinol methylase
MNINRSLSQWADRAASRRWKRTSGLTDFSKRVVPSLLKPGLRVLDVGGGRAPCLSAETVSRFGLHVTGLDIADDELRRAPPGSYHDFIVGDVASVTIPGSFDLIFSRAVLEHVQDNRAAMKNLAGALAEGGIMAHFVPCRYAPFAVLNRLLGNRLAKRLLLSVYPKRIGVSGFKAYYDRCLPTQMAAFCRDGGMEIVELKPCFVSDYWKFFAPAHILDLCRQRLMQTLGVADLAETFTIVMRKPVSRETSGRSVAA